MEIAYGRARELCDELGETLELFLVLRGLAAYYSVRADFDATQDLAERCLGLADQLMIGRCGSVPNLNWVQYHTSEAILLNRLVK